MWYLFRKQDSYSANLDGAVIDSQTILDHEDKRRKKHDIIVLDIGAGDFNHANNKKFKQYNLSHFLHVYKRETTFFR